MSENKTEASGVDINEAFGVVDSQSLQQLLAEHQAQLNALPAEATAVERALIQLEIATDLLALEQKQQAWDIARQCLDVFVSDAHWQQAVEACDVMYQSETDGAILALAHGVWLAVTYPIVAKTTIAMLQHVVDETPSESDGAAVAAVSAHYIAEIRSESDEERDSLSFLTTQLIAQVAKRHSNVEDQEILDFWMEKLELKDPAVFLPRLATILDVIVADNWWFDRDALRAQLPVN